MNNRVSRWTAGAVSAALSVLFLVVYGGCNWFIAHRSHVGSFYFEWEHRVPFVGFLIPAYLSLDLFFIGAPFLCRTNDEVRVLSKRIAAAILIAGICFLLWPLRFAFPRPAAPGSLRLVFDWFRHIDAPYNLFPSLHAALLLIVADVYIRNLGRVLRVVAISWFVLIGISPVLTYQHHVIDIIGGFLLAAGCFYWFPAPGVSHSTTANPRIGLYYIAGSAAALALALVFQGWMMLFFWPATALAIVSRAYFQGEAAVYRKGDGRLPWSTRIIFAPVLLGQQLSLFYYKGKSRRCDAVTGQLWMGGKLGARDAKKALDEGVTAVLDLTAEFSETKLFREMTYLNVPVLDLTAPTQEQLRQMTQFIAEHTSAGIVYVHCKIGYSRSAAAVAAYLLTSGRVNTAEEAFAAIRRVRPSVIIRAEVESALRQFEFEHRTGLMAGEDFLLASTPQAFA